MSGPSSHHKFMLRVPPYVRIAVYKRIKDKTFNFVLSSDKQSNSNQYDDTNYNQININDVCLLHQF